MPFNMLKQTLCGLLVVLALVKYCQGVVLLVAFFVVCNRLIVVNV